MKESKEDKKLIEKESLSVINGGKTTIYNKECVGDGNIVGTNANYEQMLKALDELDKSGRLDYLKRK